jgi:hypothetical protein
MRALRVVGITEGGGELSVVLEDSSRQERFTVPADEQLRAAARGDLTRLGQIAIELESQLRPREIQARIRAGASVDQVAAAAGVPSQKIERFAYPVLLERSRTAEVAQRAHPMRADGPDTRMLGDVVAHTFGLRGQEYVSAEWDSWKGDDGRWVVALSWRAGRSDNRALWAFQPGAHGGTVTAIDEHAHDLVEGLPARPLRTVGPVIEMARPDDQPHPAPEEGHELRAAASDIAARRDVSDWSRVAPEPRRPEPRRPAARPEPGDVPHREPYARSGRADEPATEWPASQRQPESARRSGEPADGAPATGGGQADDRPLAPPLGRTDDRPQAAGSPQTDENSSTSESRAAANSRNSGTPTAGHPTPAGGPATAQPSATPSGTTPSGTTPSGATPSNGSPSGATASGTTPGNASPSGATPANGSPSGATASGATPANTSLSGAPASGTTPAASPATPADNGTRPSAAAAANPPAPTTEAHAPQAEADVPSARSPQAEASDQPAGTTAADTATADNPPTEPPAPRQAEPEAAPAQQTPKRTRKGKPVMPSWDEVLLGVRSQR